MRECTFMPNVDQSLLSFRKHYGKGDELSYSMSMDFVGFDEFYKE